MKLGREQRIQAYHKLLELKKQGITRKDSIARVSKGFQISKGTLYTWHSGSTRPYGVGEIRFRKEIFYVLGALLGDGCYYRWKRRKTGGHEVVLTGDMRFAMKYARKLSLCMWKNAKAYPNRRQNIWVVRMFSTELYLLLRESRKSPKIVLEMAKKKDYCENALQFVEGLFDAEGCVKLVKEHVRKTHKVCLDVTNTDYSLLEVMRVMIRDVLGIDARYSSQKAYLSKDGYPRKKSYHLRIYKKVSVAKFLQHISTTKLTKKKEPYVHRWLSVENCHPRHSCSSRSPAPS